jgi:hypothetical protein
MYLNSTDEGGLHLPMKSGFRTDVAYKDEIRICQITFEKDEASPGTSELVEIQLWLHTDEEVEYFSNGNKCSILESTAIGTLSKLSLMEDELFK